MRDFKIIENAVFRNDLLQQMAEARGVPRAMIEGKNRPTLGRLRHELKRAIKGLVGRFDPQVGRQDHQRIDHRPDNRFGDLALRVDEPLRPLQIINVH